MSVYLDAIRLGAATVVLLAHARNPRFTDGWLNAFGHYGNDAVMVFFVLSGFVIAWCADHKDRTLNDYSLARLARLYSVVLPCLCLTVLLDGIGSRVDPEIYAGPWYQADQPLLRFFANLLFVNQIWFAAIVPFSNGPFWSLGFEFWFYVLFGLWRFLAGRARTVALAAVALLIGPKILLLLPVWMMGCATYHLCRRYTLSSRAGLLLMIGTAMGYVLFRYFDMPMRLNWHTARILGHEVYEIYLNGSKEFLASYITGMLVAINFIGSWAVAQSIRRLPATLDHSIRVLAGGTFTMYLLHYPLLNFFAAVFHNDPASGFDQACVLLSTVAAVYAVSSVIEPRKEIFRRVFQRGLRQIG